MAESSESLGWWLQSLQGSQVPVLQYHNWTHFPVWLQQLVLWWVGNVLDCPPDDRLCSLQAGGQTGRMNLGSLWAVGVSLYDHRYIFLSEIHKPHLSRHRRVKHKLLRVHSGSKNTGDTVPYPSTGETWVPTLRLSRAPVLHHTQPTQRVGVIGTTGTVCMLGALLYRYLEHLYRGEGGVITILGHYYTSINSRRLWIGRKCLL